MGDYWVALEGRFRALWPPSRFVEFLFLGTHTRFTPTGRVSWFTDDRTGECDPARGELTFWWAIYSTGE